MSVSSRVVDARKVASTEARHARVVLMLRCPDFVERAARVADWGELGWTTPVATLMRVAANEARRLASSTWTAPLASTWTSMAATMKLPHPDI
jgi:hypothetical protein